MKQLCRSIWINSTKSQSPKVKFDKNLKNTQRFIEQNILCSSVSCTPVNIVYLFCHLAKTINNWHTLQRICSGSEIFFMENRELSLVKGTHEQQIHERLWLQCVVITLFEGTNKRTTRSTCQLTCFISFRTRTISSINCGQLHNYHSQKQWVFNLQWLSPCNHLFPRISNECENFSLSNLHSEISLVTSILFKYFYRFNSRIV